MIWSGAPPASCGCGSRSVRLDVPVSLLLAIADVPEAPLRGILADLQAAEFLRDALAPLTSKSASSTR